uniref:Putative ribonuclease H-like domain-containing protein n=1 Tax=Tanacetum cinerariifolium TaxID=118510 RepID=A0A6L2MXJ1_TANCI|nr:putative ribonuclease H-like domain-containing protein [Tanacetum cinerariifolium]
MDLESTQNNDVVKLPLLSKATMRCGIPRIIANADGTSTLTISGPVTTEEKAQKRNDVKSRSMLLMALPNEHLLTFSQYKDAKTLFEAIQARFDESLDSIFNRRNKQDLETMSFDDLYNNFKIVKQEVKRTVVSSSSSRSPNMAFISSPSSTNEVNTASIQVSLVITPVSTVISPDNTANLSDATVYRTGKKITINKSDTAGYDKAKVEFFNCHKIGHFERECKSPRSQERDPKAALRDTGIFDIGCSRHMTGNRSFLLDYQEYDGGFVAFAGSSKGVSAGNRTNGIASLKIHSDTGQEGKEKTSDQEYILLPVLNTSLDVPSSNKEVVFLPKDDAGKKSIVEPTCVEGGKIDDLGCLDQQIKSTYDFEITNSTNSFNTANPTVNITRDKDGTFQRTYGEWNFSKPITVNVAGSFFSHPAALDDFFKMPNLEDTGIFDDAYDDRDEGAEADYNHLEIVIPVSPIPATRIHKYHPKEQIIREVNSVVQTRKMAKRNEAGLITFINNVKSTSTPMETYKPLSKDSDGTDVDVHLYRSMIRSLIYLTSSRPDITFVVYACSRFQVQPKVSQMHAVKRIFRYLKGHPTLGLWYPKDLPLDLIAYSDNYYVGVSLDRKSTTGGCQFLGSRLISWQCKKQIIMANSTTNAKYIAAFSCCGQVLWLQNQLLNYGYNFMQTKIHVDNESAIYVVKNPAYHSKMKHIEIRHHFIRDSYEKRLIEMVKINTDSNVADLLTKAFDVTRFQFLVASIGLLNL